MNEIEHLHQIILNLAARLQATEAIANTAIAMICADGDTEKCPKDKFLTEKFPALLLNAINAPAQATKPELDAWLRQREQDFLNASLAKIVAQIEPSALNSKNAVN